MELKQEKLREYSGALENAIILLESRGDYPTTCAILIELKQQIDEGLGAQQTEAV